MYNPEQKQVILKNSFGVSYHIYFESGRGLCLRMLSESRVWSRGYILSDQAVNDFSVTLDQDDVIHFVFQTKDGRILYGHGKHGQMEIQPILSSRDTNPWPKHVCIFISGETILFFYILRYQNRHLISMQTIHNNQLSKPVAIDYIDGPDIQYLAYLDIHNRCHLIYTNAEGNQTRLNHRVLKEDFSVFHAAEKVYASPYNILFPSVVCSSDNQTHLIFQVHSDNAYEVLYKNLSASSSFTSLYKSSSPPGYTGLVFHKKVFTFFRVLSNHIYSMHSENNGKAWSNEAIYPFGTGGSLTCFMAVTRFKKEAEDSYFFLLPGNFSKGYQLAFIHSENLPDPLFSESFPPSPVSSLKNHPAPAKQAPQQNSMPILKETEEAHSIWDEPRMKEIQKNILSLKNLTENMQRELTKLWLTQKENEKKLDQLIRTYQNRKNDSFLMHVEPEEKYEDSPQHLPQSFEDDPQEQLSNEPEYPFADVE